MYTLGGYDQIQYLSQNLRVGVVVVVVVVYFMTNITTNYRDTDN